MGLEMPASPVRCTTILTLLLACGNPAIAQTSTPSSSSPTEGRSEQYNVPPPPGYKPPPGRFVQSDREREEDDRYSREAERWAAENCIADRRSNIAAGAVIGGLIGALAGSGLAGRYDRAPATVLGAGAGAVAGSAIARNASPDCPPGFVVKAAPEPFYPPPVYPHVYVAPPWYDPWVWYGGHWIYRPYPYHRYWYKRHWRRR
jgi:hypothetical protein